MIEVGQLLGSLFFGSLVFGGIGAIAWKIRRDSVDDVTDMRSVALVRVVDARDEQMVRVAGRVVAEDGALLTAPVSGRPCVAWELSFTTPAFGGERIMDRRDTVGFIVEDDSGRAHVAAEIAVWALQARAEGEGPGKDVPPTLAAWLAENHASDQWREIRRLRWRETRVEPGDQIAVVGIAHVSIDSEGEAATYRDAPTRVVIDGSDDAPLSIADDPSLR